MESHLPPYEGETYYDLPAIKASHYGWPITAYFFVGGLASAAQFIATIVDLLGRKEDRVIVRAGRYLALLGALISPPLLIVDLHTPRRWYNMLRIYRPTSPMSIGAWALTAFGLFSGVTVAGQTLEDWTGSTFGRWIARVFQIPAALAAGVVALYTGTLLVATNPPFWASLFPYISSLFASSAASTASAALAIVTEAAGSPGSTRRLERLSVFSGLVELVLAVLVGRRWRQEGVDEPVRKAPLSQTYRFGVLGLGILAPLAVHLTGLLTGRRSHRGIILASLAALTGGFLLRALFIFGGNQSARRPRDYFHVSQPG